MSVLSRSAAFALLFVVVAAILAGASRPAGAMDFKLVTLSTNGECRQHCPSVMVATGSMSLGTMDAFISFAQQAAARGSSNVLIIDSPGGHLIEGIKLGMALRRLRTTVFVGRVIARDGTDLAVDGSCMSACVYALMGGNRRFVKLGSNVGVHRELLPSSMGHDPQSVFRSTQRFPEITAMLVRYTRQMGVDPALVALAEQYGPGGIRILTPGDLAHFRLAKVSR
jgi:hypothetical protein